jgi:hypothetical protein
MPPTKHDIRNTITKGVDGRPPLWKWSREDIKRYHPAKLSDAEILAGYFDRFIMVRFYPVLECREAEIAVIGVSKRSQ